MDQRLAQARKAIEGYGFSTSSLSEACPDCGALVPQVPEGPVHAYFGASPGCWALYSAMLGHEFGCWDAGTHRLSVDTYAVQHPGTSTRQAAVNSVGIHLIALCLVFDRSQPVERVIRAMDDLSKGRRFQLHQLAPPQAPYPVTIVDLIDASSPEAYNAGVLRWAESAWESWAEHHDQVRAWADLTLRQTQR
jgi:hypothetical protein